MTRPLGSKVQSGRLPPVRKVTVVRLILAFLLGRHSGPVWAILPEKLSDAATAPVRLLVDMLLSERWFSLLP